jgi:hypothetical protein
MRIVQWLGQTAVAFTFASDFFTAEVAMRSVSFQEAAAAAAP